MDSTDDDDLFATLGGSLMKDLLADLNDDADASFLSLEQLEKELAHLDSKPYGALPTVTEETPSAASMVVAAAQQQQHQGSLYGDTVLDSSARAMDAWSLSLQKFTAASLEQDFLQADSARKAMFPSPTPAGPPPTTTTSVPSASSSAPKAPPGLEQLLSKAEEYDVQERLLFRPPPGLGEQQNVAQQVAEKLEKAAKGEKEPAAPPVPRPMPATPQNSMAFDLPQPAPPTPQNSITVTNEGIVQPMVGMVPPKAGPPAPMPEALRPPPTPPVPIAPQGHPPHEAPRTMAPLTAVPIAMPMGHAPPPQRQGPWQGMPPPPAQVVMPPPRPVYANPHPDAPPIPAQALATPLMTVRDISYVVHSILKPILALGTTPFDYDQVYWRRRGQGLRPGKNTQGATLLEKEMKSRGEKAKEWSNQHATLGKSAKANVSRPRALIAQPVVSEGTPGGEEKQRQTLWKARIYCDQAYQAYMQVVEAWESSPGTTVPANLQPHLVKLLRCLGISLKENETNQEHKPTYAIDPSGLSLLLKLAKGRVLLTRLLEQALLPPASVQVLLPPALQVLYQSSVPTQDMVDDGVFAAWARVINSLPDLSGTCIMEGTQVILQHTNEALQSTSRMQAVHGLLRRGSMLAASDPDFAKEWSSTEAEFMKVFQQ